jgi:hypothetical protein
LPFGVVDIRFSRKYSIAQREGSSATDWSTVPETVRIYEAAPNEKGNSSRFVVYCTVKTVHCIWTSEFQLAKAVAFNPHQANNA